MSVTSIYIERLAPLSLIYMQGHVILFVGLLNGSLIIGSLSV